MAQAHLLRRITVARPASNPARLRQTRAHPHPVAQAQLTQHPTVARSAMTVLQEGQALGLLTHHRIHPRQAASAYRLPHRLLDQLQPQDQGLPQALQRFQPQEAALE